MTGSILLVLLLPLLATGTAIQLKERDEFSTGFGTYRRRAFHTIAVLDNYLYIEGGNMSAAGDQVIVNDTLSIPLSTSWKISSVQPEIITHPDGMPTISRHASWVDTERKTFYRWGGDLGSAASKAYSPKLFMMEADGQGGGSWKTVSPSNSDLYQGTKGSRDRAFASCDGIGYMVGGWTNKGTDYTEASNGGTSTPDLIEYNMTSREWRKDTARGLNPPNGDIALAEAVCIPGFTDRPLLMVLGGRDTNERLGSSTADRDLSQIHLYDPNTRQWHINQTAGFEAEGPRGREHFCSVGVQSKNNSYEIFVFGGYRASDQSLRNDVWILSLPAFRWFRGPVTTYDRMAHRCAVVGKRQMISVGGLSSGTSTGFKSNDTWMNGIGILDMTSLIWRDEDNPSVDDYESPDPIKEWYSSGKASNISLSEGLQKIFFKNEIEDNGSQNNSSWGDISSSNESDDINKTPLIAGATVGGVAALALLITALWLLHRKFYTRRDAALQEGSEDTAPLPKGAASTATHSTSDLQTNYDYPEYFAPDAWKTQSQFTAPATELDCFESRANWQPGPREQENTGKVELVD